MTDSTVGELIQNILNWWELPVLAGRGPVPRNYGGTDDACTPQKSLASDRRFRYNYSGPLKVEDEPGIGSSLWGLFWKHGRYWRNNSRFNKHGTQERQLVGGILIVTQRFCLYKATLPIADG